MAPGRVDRPLDATVVETLLAEQFPDLAGRPVRRWSAGWDNELFMVGDDVVFRFPKRAERVRWLIREIALMPVAADALGDLVPAFEWYGEPSAAFPYPFVGYRCQPGVGADQTGTATASLRLAHQVGDALTRLHRSDPRRVPPPPEDLGATSEGLLARMASLGEQVAPLLEPPLAADVSPYLDGSLDPPDPPSDLRVIHNDICPDHVLVDPETGDLTGLIDWSDAVVGDPVMDFVGLIGIGDHSFIAAVLANYRLGVDEGFAVRLDWWAKRLTLTWLAEAARADPEQVAKHLTWVRRAFAGWELLSCRR